MDIGRHLGENRGVLRRLLALASLLPACGPGSADPEPTTTAAISSGEAGSSSTSLGDATGTPTTGTSTTGTSTTGTSTTGTTTGTSTTSTSTTSTSTGTTSSTDTTAGTTGGADVEYAAYFWAGGLDHILIHRADFVNERCATLHLARPGGINPAFQISAPDEWSPVDATITDSTMGCLEDMPMGTSIAASGGLGMVSWPPDPNQLCPPQIDLDLVLDFPPDPPWVPAQTPMLVTALPVKNCP